MGKKAKGMTPREIRAEMVLRGIKLKDVAEEAGVTPGFVHQVIYGVRRSKGYRVRPFLAKAINKKVEDVWPDTNSTKEQKKKACL